MKATILLMASAVILSGCETPEPFYYAYRSGTTVAQKVSDSTDCKVEATNRIAPSTQIATTPVYQTPVYMSPLTTSCYGNTCTTTGGQITGGQTYGGDAYSYDASQPLRAEVARQCMARKGYIMIPSQTCISQQVPKGLTASPTDVLKPMSGDFCMAILSPEISVPVSIK